MELLRLNIEPKSSFISFPKGDMVFGYFASHLFRKGDNRLSNCINSPTPSIIFSDFLPKDFLPKPTLPQGCFGENLDKKEFKEKNWIESSSLQDGKLEECKKLNFFSKEMRVRNSINRVTFTTDSSGVFAPYGKEELIFEYQPVLYVMYDKNEFSKDDIINNLKEMGKQGFGKRASIGRGVFDVKDDESFKEFKKSHTNYYMTLSPTILNDSNIEDAYYNLYNKFGKYSFSHTPFKKPVVMADSAAVIELSQPQEYIGRAIDNGINEKSPSFVQGYSILVPFILDEAREKHLKIEEA